VSSLDHQRANSSVNSKIEALLTQSVDDDPKEWNFSTFAGVFEEMKTADTTIGSIVGAMLYHIE